VGSGDRRGLGTEEEVIIVAVIAGACDGDAGGSQRVAVVDGRMAGGKKGCSADWPRSKRSEMEKR
jgi:hypothetical protein